VRGAFIKHAFKKELEEKALYKSTPHPPLRVGLSHKGRSGVLLGF